MALTHRRAASLPVRLLTVADLEAIETDAAKTIELYHGVVQETEPMGMRHDEVQVRIIIHLAPHVLANGLGQVYTEGTHFVLFRNPDTVVMPDVSFVRADRLPPEAERYGIAPYPPDFAVEVLSPSNRPGDALEKAGLYLRAGVRLIWLVAPRAHTVTVFTADAEPRTLGEGETLDGGDVIPGFTLPVADIFR